MAQLRAVLRVRSNLCIHMRVAACDVCNITPPVQAHCLQLWRGFAQACVCTMCCACPADLTELGNVLRQVCSRVGRGAGDRRSGGSWRRDICYVADLRLRLTCRVLISTTALPTGPPVRNGWAAA